MRTERAIIVSAVAIAALFGVGIVRLFLLRFEAGDVYPPYSSMRSDPLGTRALYESLAACRHVAVERNFGPPEQLILDPDTALLFLGDTISEDDEVPLETAGVLSRFVRKGGRLVFAFRTQTGDDWDWTDEDDAATNHWSRLDDPAHPENDAETNKPACHPAPEEDDEEETVETVSVGDWLGIEVGEWPLTNEPVASLSSNLVASSLPAALSCHTVLVFARDKEHAKSTNAPSACARCSRRARHAVAEDDRPVLHRDWQTIYARDGKPVVIERKLGRGSIVLSAPVYFVSNEAMRDARSADLLVWLTGGKRRVIFDEFHHGLERNVGLAGLARQYRLHGLAAGVLLLAALFIWQNSVSLVPRGRHDSGAAEDLAEGKGSAAGLVNLLRRNIPSRDILRVCFDEWRKTFPARTAADARTANELQALVETEALRPAHKRDPARVYDEMAKVLNGAGRFGVPHGAPKRAAPGKDKQVFGQVPNKGG